MVSKGDDHGFHDFHDLHDLHDGNGRRCLWDLALGSVGRESWPWILFAMGQHSLSVSSQHLLFMQCMQEAKENNYQKIQLLRLVPNGATHSLILPSTLANNKNSGARAPFSEHRSRVHVFNSKRGMVCVAFPSSVWSRRNTSLPNA